MSYKTCYPETMNVQETKYVKIVQGSFYNTAEAKEEERATFKLNPAVEKEDDEIEICAKDSSSINWRRSDKQGSQPVKQM